MNKTIKILFAASLALALFSCKKEEAVVTNGDSAEYWANGKTLVVFINQADTATVPTISEKNQKANAVISNKDAGAELVLNDVLTGYRTLTLKCELNGNTIFVDTTEFWDGGRKVAVKGYVDNNVLTLRIADIHAEAFTDQKWMLGEVIDESDIVKSWGYDSIGQKMPAIYLKSSVDTLYIPMLSTMLNGGNLSGSCAISVDSILTSFQSLARVVFATSDIEAFIKSYSDRSYIETKASSAPTVDGGPSIAMIDYIEFTSTGKFGIGLNDHHAVDFFKEAKREQVYRQLDSVYNFYSLSGSPITELVDAQNSHCILNYYEGVGQLTGKPMLFVSTGVIGGAVIDVVNSLLYSFESSLHIDAETINVPIRLFEASSDKLVLGVAVNEILGLLDTLANDIDKCTYEQFTTEYFPNLNSMLYWLFNSDEAAALMNSIMGRSYIYAENGVSEYGTAASGAGVIISVRDHMVRDPWRQMVYQYGLADFQINEDMFNIVKPILSSVLRVFASLKTVELSAEIEFMPYEKCRRPWEYVPKL